MNFYCSQIIDAARLITDSFDRFRKRQFKEMVEKVVEVFMKETNHSATPRFEYGIDLDKSWKSVKIQVEGWERIGFLLNFWEDGATDFGAGICTLNSYWPDYPNGLLPEYLKATREIGLPVTEPHHAGHPTISDYKYTEKPSTLIPISFMKDQFFSRMTSDDVVAEVAAPLIDFYEQLTNRSSSAYEFWKANL